MGGPVSRSASALFNNKKRRKAKFCYHDMKWKVNRGTGINHACFTKYFVIMRF